MLKVNPYCKNWGWLFEDLKRSLATVVVDNVHVQCSDDPLPDADVWIAIRTNEGVASPEPARTIIQWHDYRAHEAVWTRLNEFACLQCVHPSQWHQAPDAKRVEVCRIGYRDAFKCRRQWPDCPTIGWIGRDVVWQGRHIKHPGAFVRLAFTLRSQFPTLRTRIYGPGIANGEPGSLVRYAAQSLATLVSGDRSVESLQRFFNDIDLLVVTGEPEPGPLTIYESIACGVPVVTLPTGAADVTDEPLAILTGETLDRVESHCLLMLKRRQMLFQHRYSIRETVTGITQEKWAQFTIELATLVA